MLRSNLFKGVKELEDASRDHSKHIVRNHKKTGLFVSRIQEALIILDRAVITGDEVSTQRYGDSTADAVQAYKRARSIINRNYQQEADDIVGIMTMERLDREMAAIEARMGDLFETARIAAFQRTFAAFLRIVPLFAPEPGRVDPNERNRLEALRLARDIFDDPNPDLDDIGAELGDMKNRLMAKNFELVHLPDPRIASRAAFVVGNRLPYVLCPLFFGTTDEERIRTLVHESAHLTGVGDPDGESYYLLFNRRNEPPAFTVGAPRSTRRSDFADTWAKYVNAVTGQPADPDNVVRR